MLKWQVSESFRNDGTGCTSWDRLECANTPIKGNVKHLLVRFRCSVSNTLLICFGVCQDKVPSLTKIQMAKRPILDLCFLFVGLEIVKVS